MKELSMSEIKEVVRNFSSGWMKIGEGESAKFTIVSKTIHCVPDGEEGLDGSTIDYERWQCKVEDKDGIVKVLTVQQRLAKSMLTCLEDEELDWDEYFQGSEWNAERIDQYNWKVKLLNWKNKEGSSAAKESRDIPIKSEPKKKSPSKKDLELSDNAQIAYNLIVNNELSKKDMTQDSLKTVISSLTELNLDNAIEALEELIKNKVLKVSGEKVTWLI